LVNPKSTSPGITAAADNPLGVKGLGEGGAIAPPAAIANAVEDALKRLGVIVHRAPLSRARVRGRWFCRR
jgi:aerobic carbon-monoxide dehydrogenase large subunit